MADSFVQVAPDSTGKKLDTAQLTQGGSDIVQRQRASIADDANVDSHARVFSNNPASTDFGLVVREIPVANTRSDTFTGVGNGVTVTSAGATQSYGIQVVSTGSVASVWDIRLEGSLDNVNFSTILQHTTATGNGAVLWSGASIAPALFFRARAATLTLGLATNVVVTILGI